MLSGLWSTAKIDVNNGGLISCDEFVTNFEAELTTVEKEFSEIISQFMLVARACHARKKHQASLDESSGGALTSSDLAGTNVSSRSPGVTSTPTELDQEYVMVSIAAAPLEQTTVSWALSAL